MMKVPFVDLSAQYATISEQIDKAIRQVFLSGQFIGGPEVDRFEKNFAEFSETKYCVSCANGTDALEISLQALGVGKGDEVIIPAMSWVSTASAVHTVGAKPVFVDIDSDTYTICPERIKEKITERTQAIIPVHLYGQMSDMATIKEIASEYDVFVIEDSAQGVGASQNNEKPGRWSDVAIYSFYPAKNLGAYGDAGAIVTNEEVYAKSCRVLARLGQKDKHNHVALGRNSCMDALQAAILSTKLDYLDKWNQRRNTIAKLYGELLSDLPIQLPVVKSGNYSNYHLFVIQVPNRKVVFNKMLDQGVSCQIHYPKALNDLPPLRHLDDNEYPIAKQLSENGLSLPIYPEMKKEQIEYVAAVLRRSLQ